MLRRMSLFCSLLLILLSAGSMPVATAADRPCACSSYFMADDFTAMVIDNESGRYDYIAAAQHDFLDREPVFRVRPRAPDVDVTRVVTDCSVEGLRCAEIHHRDANASTVLAFKPGVAGDRYSIRGVAFEILSAGTFAERTPTPRKVYWVRFTAPAPLKSGDFVYVEGAGVVRYVSADVAEFHKIGARFFPMVLVNGPGLLSPGGFPSGGAR